MPYTEGQRAASCINACIQLKTWLQIDFVILFTNRVKHHMFENKRSKIEGLIFHEKCFPKTDRNSQKNQMAKTTS